MRAALAALFLATSVAKGICGDLIVVSIYFPGDGYVFNHDTASGQRLDTTKLTCAHRTLPFGTHLTLQHGEYQAKVVINDRGPFVRGRGLDCTPAVDKQLHLDGLGSVRVLSTEVN